MFDWIFRRRERALAEKVRQQDERAAAYSRQCREDERLRFAARAYSSDSMNVVNPLNLTSPLNPIYQPTSYTPSDNTPSCRIPDSSPSDHSGYAGSCDSGSSYDSGSSSCDSGSSSCSSD